MNEVTPISYEERKVTPNLDILACVDYAKAMSEAFNDLFAAPIA